MSWLQHKEYVPYAPEDIGTVNKHHCKDGKDNDKLFITRCEDGYTILAYCHHCGKRGRFNTLKHSTIQQIKSIAKLNKHGIKSSKGFRHSSGYRLPTDYQQDYREWGRGAYVWLKRYGITDEEISRNRIGYSETYGRVVLPSFGAKELDFMVMRRVNSLDTDSPKYLTYSNVEHVMYIPQGLLPGGVTNSVVLTEDILSAIKVARYIPSIALLGTVINIRALEYVANNYNNVIVFMDDDNLQVKKKQLDIKNRLEPFVKAVIIIHSNGVDPKEMSDDKLKEVLGL